VAPGERVASRHFVLLRLAKLAKVVALAWGAGCLMLRGRMGFPRGMILDWLRDLNKYFHVKLLCGRLLGVFEEVARS